MTKEVMTPAENDASEDPSDGSIPLEELQWAVDTVLEYIEAVGEQDDRPVDELAFDYMSSVIQGDQDTARQLAPRFVCRFAQWVGAVAALRAMRLDEHMHARALDVAINHMQLPPRPPAPKRKKAG